MTRSDLYRWAAIGAIVGGMPLGLEELLPQSIQKIPAVVFGLAINWLGYALWSERGEMTARAS